VAGGAPRWRIDLKSPGLTRNSSITLAIAVMHDDGPFVGGHVRYHHATPSRFRLGVSTSHTMRAANPRPRMPVFSCIACR
jgi:hypothetical protein